MRKEGTQKQKDQWQASREKGVKKYQARIKAKVLVPVKKKSPVLKSKPKKKKKTYKIRKKAPGQIKRDAMYHKIRRMWFKDPENQVCKMRLTEMCKENQQPASDVHHQKGKIGERYFDTKFFLPACRLCHIYELAHDAEAKAKGISLLRLGK